MLAHFRLVIPFAEREFLVSLFEARKLIVIEVDSKAWFIWNPYTAVFKTNPAANDHFVLFGLPRVMGIAGV